MLRHARRSSHHATMHAYHKHHDAPIHSLVLARALSFLKSSIKHLPIRPFICVRSSSHTHTHTHTHTHVHLHRTLLTLCSLCSSLMRMTEKSTSQVRGIFTRCMCLLILHSFHCIDIQLGSIDTQLLSYVLWYHLRNSITQSRVMKYN